MKMFYGNTPVKSMKVGTDTNDATMIASDLQAGKTGYSGGRKIVGTGKCFSFASYGDLYTNDPWPIPTNINVIEIGCDTYPVQLLIPLKEMKSIDFSATQILGNIVIDGTSYQVTVDVIDNILTVACEQTIKLQAFYGKDEYV